MDASPRTWILDCSRRRLAIRPTNTQQWSWNSSWWSAALKMGLGNRQQMVYMPHSMIFGTKCEFCDKLTKAADKIATRDGDTYRGKYSLDGTTGKASGNPAQSATVKDMMSTIYNKCAAKGSHRRDHAEAMKIEDMRTIMHYSMQVAPACMLQACCPISDIVQLRVLQIHGLMRAFITTGFTVWTRCV
jgi:hypothetical protein